MVGIREFLSVERIVLFQSALGTVDFQELAVLDGVGRGSVHGGDHCNARIDRNQTCRQRHDRKDEKKDIEGFPFGRSRHRGARDGCHCCVSRSVLVRKEIPRSSLG